MMVMDFDELVRHVRSMIEDEHSGSIQDNSSHKKDITPKKDLEKDPQQMSDDELWDYLVQTNGQNNELDTSVPAAHDTSDNLMNDHAHDALDDATLESYQAATYEPKTLTEILINKATVTIARPSEHADALKKTPKHEK
jgi:hypothetical protein